MNRWRLTPFFRNPGNPPVYPLRYEKKGGSKNVVEREKGRKWMSQEKTIPLGCDGGAHPTSQEFGSGGLGTGSLQQERHCGHQEAGSGSTCPSLFTEDIPFPEVPKMS